MIIRIILFPLLIMTAAVQAEQMESGEKLHEQHCTGCHSADVYTREQRIVNSLDDLVERVRQCELNNDMTWFDEEINAIVSYLNSKYYRFDVK